MRLALPCYAYTPKHAAPREPLAPSSRQALAVGLAAALLPLGAAPAFADEAPATPAATTATATEPLADSAAAPAVLAAAPVVAAPAAARAATTLTLSAPAAARTTRVHVGVRLLAAGHGVRNGYVRLEKSTGSGWTYAGRLLTNGGGVGNGTLRVSGGASLRATYAGATTRTPAVSAVLTVRAPNVRAASASTVGDLRGRAIGRSILKVAARYVGTPYRYGATGPSAFDCSGFTRYVYGRIGVRLPHNSGAQASATRRVSKAAARPGDLVVMAGHVGIYAGAGRMYDAPHAGSRVSLRRIYTSHYSLHRVV